MDALATVVAAVLNILGMETIVSAPEPSPLLNLARMAHRLGVTCSWLRAEARAGRVPCLLAGRELLFNPDAVEKRLADRAASERLKKPGVAHA